MYVVSEIISNLVYLISNSRIANVGDITVCLHNSLYVACSSEQLYDLFSTATSQSDTMANRF